MKISRGLLFSRLLGRRSTPYNELEVLNSTFQASSKTFRVNIMVNLPFILSWKLVLCSDGLRREFGYELVLEIFAVCLHFRLMWRGDLLFVDVN